MISPEEVKKHLQDAADFEPSSLEELETFRLQYSGKKGILNKLYAELKEASPEEKRELGKPINLLKSIVEEKINTFKEQLEQLATELTEKPDLSLPGDPMELGSRHPINIVKNRIIEIFARIGFSVAEGQEIEDDWHNFTALNFPPDHPARDMQDTFFVNLIPDPSPEGEGRSVGVGPGQWALRTHTSSVQVRLMEKQKPPIRSIMPGRVYRNEAVSARSNCFFHQVEGLYIDEGVSFADLKQVCYYFSKEMFGADTKIRLRPSYFPFTEPSAEMDASCLLCGGKGCNVCKHTGWLEIMGCGMVDPHVLTNCNIDPGRYSGYAFGMGIDRMAMLLFGVKDIRIFFENNVRFLKQFAGVG